jgi:RNA polymerase sigma-70 factor (ECF subfamily)
MTAAPARDANAVPDPEKWVDEFGDYLLGFAMARVRNRAAAEDLVQDTLLVALKTKDRFSGRSSFRTWLTSILKFKIIDHYRAGTRTKTFTDLTTFYEDGEREAFGEGGEWRRPADQMPKPWSEEQTKNLERQDFWKAFNECADKMPERIRAVFIMREVDQIDSEEICKRMDITRDNFWTIMHRARMALRKCLEGSWFSE